MGVTIYDVAAAARVSPTTVSRVLSGGAAVAPSTQERVKDVIERMGYRPDRVAQALRRQRSAMVGLILPMADYPASMALLQGLERALARENISLLVADSSTDSAGDPIETASRLMSQRVDALLMVRGRPGAALVEAVDREQVPLVLVDSGAGEHLVDTVRVDHAAGIRQVVRLVAKEGAENLAFLGSGTATIIGMEQLQGFSEATADLSEHTTTTLRIGPSTRGFGQTITEELVARSTPPDAYVCGSDTVACAVGATLDNATLDNATLGNSTSDNATSDSASVGSARPFEDRPLVTGYGGEAWTALVRPALTTVRIPATEVAEETVRLVTRRLDGLGGDPIDILLPPTLQVREST